jgi:hypothetical protein
LIGTWKLENLEFNSEEAALRLEGKFKPSWSFFFWWLLSLMKRSVRKIEKELQKRLPFKPGSTSRHRKSFSWRSVLCHWWLDQWGKTPWKMRKGLLGFASWNGMNLNSHHSLRLVNECGCGRVVQNPVLPMQLVRCGCGNCFVMARRHMMNRPILYI